MTPAGARLLGAFIAHERAHGIPPTIRELGKVLAMTSTNAVSETIDRLVADGHLERVGPKGSSRSIRLPRDPVEAGDAADRLRGAVLLALDAGLTREQAWRVVDETLHAAPARGTDGSGARPRRG